METLNIHLIWIGSPITPDIERIIYDKAVILYAFFKRSYCLKFNIWTDKSYGQPIKNPELIRLKKYLETIQNSPDVIKYLNPIPLIKECAGHDFFKLWEVLKGPVPFKSLEYDSQLGCEKQAEWSAKYKGDNLAPFLAAASDVIKVLCLFQGQGRNLYIDMGLKTHDEFEEMNLKKAFPEFHEKCEKLEKGIELNDRVYNTKKNQDYLKFLQSSRNGVPLYNAEEDKFKPAKFDKLKIWNLKADPDFWQKFEEAHPCMSFNGQGIPKFRSDVNVAAVGGLRDAYSLCDEDIEYLKDCNKKIWMFDLQIMYSRGTEESINFFRDVLKNLKLVAKQARYDYQAAALGNMYPPVYKAFVKTVLQTPWLLEYGDKSKNSFYANQKTGVKEGYLLDLKLAGQGVPIFGGLYFKDRNNPKNPMVDYKQPEQVIKTAGTIKEDGHLSSKVNCDQTLSYVYNKSPALVRAIAEVKSFNPETQVLYEGFNEESKQNNDNIYNDFAACFIDPTLSNEIKNRNSGVQFLYKELEPQEESKQNDDNIYNNFESGFIKRTSSIYLDDNNTEATNKFFGYDNQVMSNQIFQEKKSSVVKENALADLWHIYQHGLRDIAQNGTKDKSKKQLIIEAQSFQELAFMCCRRRSWGKGLTGSAKALINYINNNLKCRELLGIKVMDIDLLRYIGCYGDINEANARNTQMRQNLELYFSSNMKKYNKNITYLK